MLDILPVVHADRQMRTWDDTVHGVILLGRPRLPDSLDVDLDATRALRWTWNGCLRDVVSEANGRLIIGRNRLHPMREPEDT
jgi:hypothetical protein